MLMMKLKKNQFRKVLKKQIMRDKTEQKINQKNIYKKQITIKRIITKLKIKKTN